MSNQQPATPPPIVLTIAGFDPGSGAGVTADLQVVASHGFFGTACPTALTVQSTLGVRRVQGIAPDLLRDMLETVMDDLPPAGIKIGMLGDAGLAQVVAEVVREWRVRWKGPLVVDPVIRSSSGAALLTADAVDVLVDRLLPFASCVTPNQEELGALLGRDHISDADLAGAATELIARTGVSWVAVTGGEAAIPRDLIVGADGDAQWLQGERVETTSTHGTGCAFSTALTCHLVLGKGMIEAAAAAKRFVEASLRAAPGLGRGRGPMKLSAPAYVQA